MRQSLILRLRPFLRRDLRARLVSALLTVFVMTGLVWLGVSALSQIDSREAHQLRVDMGLEHPWTVCGGPDQPVCSYEDREQAKVDRKYSYEQRLRLAVLAELSERIDLGLGQLDDARELADSTKVSKRTGALQGDTVALRLALLRSVVDLRPAPVASVEVRRERLLWPLELPDDCNGLDFDGIGWIGCPQLNLGGEHAIEGRSAARPSVNMRTRLVEQIELERTTLTELDDQVQQLIERELPGHIGESTISRVDLVADMTPTTDILPEDFNERLSVAAWLAVRPPSAALAGWDIFDGEDDRELLSSSVQFSVASAGIPTVNRTLGSLAQNHTDDVFELVMDPASDRWHGAWVDTQAQYLAIVKPTERYRSPIQSPQRWQILGTVLFLLSGIMLIVVGPVVTATTTAREREAGTLPVLRMTGLSAGDLALAMAIGPNVYALVAGGGMLLLAIPILGITAGLSAVAMATGILLLLSAATHLTAIGLGDALGQRVNAMIVGGLLGLGLLGPGLVGATMVIGDMAATGFLLGPLPATLAAGVGLSGLPFAEHAVTGGSSEMGTTILGYALAIQTVLGMLCLLSWRRRVEQAWSPLFRPAEGALLALASVGCSALAVLDLCDRINVQTYDHVNLITFVATGFLMPVLGWLLVSSLVRPARAASVASVFEVRRAFGRFQLFVVLTAVALAGAYSLVLDRTGLGSEESEIMWATITQGILIAETAVATLLWASRRRENRHRVLILGAAVVLLQIAFAVGVYNLEVEHVAITQAAGSPFLLGMDASPYWLAFLVVLWAAGLGLILAALLRERDRAKTAEADAVLDDIEEEEKPSRRWLH